MAMAAYEHDEEAAPSPVALATGLSPSPDSAFSMRWRGTQACTMAEIAKPRTSAHQTSHAIRKAFHSPSPIFEITSAIQRSLYPARVLGVLARSRRLEG